MEEQNDHSVRGLDSNLPPGMFTRARMPYSCCMGDRRQAHPKATHAWEHGYYSAEGLATRRAIRALLEKAPDCLRVTGQGVQIIPSDRSGAPESGPTLRTADIRPADSSPEAHRNRDRQTTDAQKGRAPGAQGNNNRSLGGTPLRPLDDFGF